ncbi:MAG: TolC family protein [Fibrobacterota bacterium]
MRHLLLLIPLLFLSLTPSNALTEEELIGLAVKRSFELNRYLTEIRRSALVEKKVRRDNGAAVTLEASASMLRPVSGPGDTLDYLASVSAAAPLPGGAQARVTSTVDSSVSKTVSIGLTQPLLKGGWTGDVAGYNKKRATLEYTIAKRENLYAVLTVLADLRVAFWDACIRQERVRILALADTIAALTYAQTRTRYKAGDASPLDTLESLFNLGRVKSDRLTAENAFRAARRTVKELSGVNDADSFSLTAVRQYDSTAVAAQMAYAQAHNLELLKEEALSSAYALDARVKSNWRLPELDAQVNYSVRDEKPDFSRGSFYAGLRFKYRLMNNSSGEDYKISRLDADRQKLNVEEKQRRLSLSLLEIADNLILRTQILDNALKNTGIAEAKNRIAVEMYRQGNLAIIDKLKAEQDWINAKLDLLDAQAGLGKEIVRMELRTGEMLARYHIDESTDPEE